MNTKACNVKIKAGPDAGLAEGEFLAYASVFGDKDSYGDVVQPGAFTDTLAAWEGKGIPIPLLWGHNTADPDFNLGAIIDASEDDHGLKVHGRLDMDSPKSAQVYRLLKSGRVSQMPPGKPANPFSGKACGPCPRRRATGPPPCTPTGPRRRRCPPLSRTRA
ncbi:HK97 family phage prohead protease [Nocardia wallacei]|uniref:HK97 family phage prohead protease n=1 Tax=Nocardia wallacei TaxID=480035 RepID=UPI002453CC2A|nr:HK97 family phage prohead protease [Nocardia wallacei]